MRTDGEGRLFLSPLRLRLFRNTEDAGCKIGRGKFSYHVSGVGGARCPAYKGGGNEMLLRD